VDVFNLQAKIGLDIKEYLSSLGKASDESNKFGLDIKGAFSSAMKVGAAAIGAVVTETTALSAALVKGVGDLAEYGDHIDKQSQKMNMSAQAYQEWDAIMQHSGTSIDSMRMSIKTLANAAESGNDAFGLLGMSLEDIQRMSSEELFKATIIALQNVESDTQRTYIAGQLLGRGATELGALLNTSAEDTEKMRQRVHELGGVMSDEAVKAAAAYQDSLQDMKTSMSGLTRGITSEFLPSFTEVMDGLTNIFAGEDGGAEKVSKGIDDILGNISSAVTKLKPVVSKIGGVIASAVKENAPKLIKEGTKLFGDIVVGVVRNLPDILSTAGDVVGTIGDTLLGYLPDWLSDDIRKIVSSISGFAENIDFEKIKTSLGGLGESLEPLAEKLSSGVAWAFENVLTPLGEWLMNDAIPLGIDLISGALDNIKNVLDILEPVGKAVWEEFLSPLFSTLGDLTVGSLDLLGKGLKSLAEAFKDFDTIGFVDDIIQGKFGENWKTGISDIADSLEGFGDDIDEFFDGPGETWNRIWQNVGGAVFSAKETIVDAFSKAKSSFDEFKDDWITGMEEIVDKIDKVKEKIGGFWDFWYGFGDYLATPKAERNMIPTFGDGGRVTKPTLAIVGEKEPETIVPDSKRNQMGGNTINISINVEGGISSDYDVERIAQKLAELNVLQTRAIGGTGF
jgi:hypothetical protein